MLYLFHPTSFFFFFIPVYIIILFRSNFFPTKSAFCFSTLLKFSPFLLFQNHYKPFIFIIILYLCRNNHPKTYHNILLYCDLLISFWICPRRGRLDVWLCGKSEHHFLFMGLNARYLHIGKPSHGW